MFRAQRVNSRTGMLSVQGESIRSGWTTSVLTACLFSFALSACGGDGGTSADIALAGVTESVPRDGPPGQLPSDSKGVATGAATSTVVSTANVANVAAAATETSKTATAAANWVDVLVNDMKLFHDGPTAVLESLRGWGPGALRPEAKAREPSGWQYAIPWTHTTADTGHVNGNGYPWRVAGPYTGNQAPNTRVQQRDIQMWWLLGNGQWVLGTHNPRPGTVMYPLHWAEGTETRGADIWRDEANNGGGASMRSIGREAYARHLWHAWAGPHRIPANAVGVVTVYFARLILDNPNGPDDRNQAHLLSAGGGDYYRDEATLTGFKTQGDNVIYMGFARFKYVTKDWQLFGWSNLTEAQIRANPPPLIALPK